jgi:peptidyl-prolyl cis-trans isomerase D
MLKVLRKKGVSKIILWFLAVIIILAFVVFGSSYRMEATAERKMKYAGKIFDKKVPFAEFENQLQQTIISDKLNYENNFNKIKHLLDQDRAQRTWVRILLIREAAKRNIVITDEALVQYITTYPKFQIDGKFNETFYKDILRNFLNVQPSTFEECFRDKLKIDKLVDQETASVSVSDEETKEAFRQYNEKVQVSYILFANDEFKAQVTVDENQAKEFYQAHKNDFATPPMVNIEYLRFDFAGQKSKDPGDVTQEERDAAWNKAYNIQQELKGKTDFAEIAKANNLEINESGFFSMEQPNLKAGWPFELIQQIFAMKPGEISQMVETSQGYQILRMKETKAAAMPEFAEVKTQVVEQWKTAQAAKLAKAKAEDISKKIQEAKPVDFTKTAKDLKLEVVQTAAFGRNESYLPKLGPAPDFMEKAFALTKEKPLSDVAETSKGYCLIHLDSRSEADMTDFEKEKTKFSNAILLEKKTKAFNDFLTRLRLIANLESYLPEDKKKSAQ